MKKGMLGAALIFGLFASALCQAEECLIKKGKYLKGVNRYATPKNVTCVKDAGSELIVEGKDGFNLNIPYKKIFHFGGEVARSKNVSAGEAMVFGGWAYLKAKQKSFFIQFKDEKDREQAAEFKFNRKDMDILAAHLEQKT